ncbi:hypothetical protein [Streptomyces sp. SP17KL33]|uniref:hypothetical protein n=1 Tax=Streptomyces sp. SP17KL33 TaxID=3002534 RepID=UPI002E799566|nr:hypothetical protein [Streptomyces sp. SP17KL33]MEE1838088.1 hypothetical protein [Streptomyces sp. SP17KL33]
MAAHVTYNPDITEGYTSSWAGEEFTVQPIPTGVPGIRLLAAQIGIDGPEDIYDLASMIEEAAQDTERLPQVRVFLRHGAAELRTAASLVPGEERRGNALGKAREHMVRAWRTLPGSWGFSITPDGAIHCALCGHDEPGDGTGYRPVPEVKAWYEQHALACTPLTPVECRPCVQCGYCRTAPSPIHRCSLCTCHADHE